MRPRKNIRFTGAKIERREALSIPGAKRSRNGRGSEHGALLFFAPRGAAQAGLTEGAERSSKIRDETNVESKEQPKAAPRIQEQGCDRERLGFSALIVENLQDWKPQLDRRIGGEQQLGVDLHGGPVVACRSAP